ncbi:HAMP domain-containing sensor histidine kinase [Aquipuribacter sp. MA13-6]|uniref:HAMP domain-containing sensor histidine kinase n=1 Tax=unclassified Aquipuribacter TaxID=2635084 RepID=UPI003EEB71F2
MTRRPRWTSSLGGRLALLTAVAVSVAVAAVSVAAWAATDRTLRAQVDSALVGVDRPSDLSVEDGPSPPGGPEALCGVGGQTREPSSWLGSVQLVRADGSTCTAAGGLQVAPTGDDVALAAEPGPGELRDDRAADGTHVRVRAVHLEEGYALLVVRDLTEVDATLRQLGVVLVVVTLLGALTSVLAGYLVARSGLRPLDRLTGAVEDVARTQDLSVPLPVSGDDEVARLSTAFNRMTEALRVSRARQQQLIVDAGHELRTPLTSLRTNLELLALSERSGRALPAVDRSELLLSVSAQLVELSVLVDELVELADDAPEPDPERFDLADVLERAVDRASRRGAQRVEVAGEPWAVLGDREAVERALVNLLDNALKFSPASSTVDVTLADGTVEVADRGPGVDDTTVTHAFDRFWRSPQARGLAGSGLGLAIVRDVAERHGGRADLRPRDGGGTVARLTLPPARD